MIDLALSEDQKQIVDGAAALLAEKYPVSRLHSGAAPFDAHADLAAWGWFGVGLSEALGGLGLSVAEEALLCLEAGQFLLPPSVLATTLAASLCADEDRAGLLRGDVRAALALRRGEATYVLDRGDARLLVVVGPEEIWLAPAAGFRGDRVAGFDETVTTDKGELDESTRLSGEDAGRARLLTSAMLAGIARASCDLAVAYAKIREQFGQPIGAFQAIKHMCADMGLRATAAEAQVKMAAAIVSDAPQIGSHQISSAALTSLQAARRNAEEAIQIHGGIGFTAECDAHIYLKRAHVLGMALGGLEGCRRAVLSEPVPVQA